jgi:hypothetical protein
MVAPSARALRKMSVNEEIPTENIKYYLDASTNKCICICNQSSLFCQFIGLDAHPKPRMF